MSDYDEEHDSEAESFDSESNSFDAASQPSLELLSTVGVTEAISADLGRAEGHARNLYTESWVQEQHQAHLNRIKDLGEEGYKGCKWSDVLNTWSMVLKPVPYMKLHQDRTKSILKFARLQGGHPFFAYEFLRRLGSSILADVLDSDDGPELDAICQTLRSFPLNEEDSAATKTAHERIVQLEPSEIKKHLRALHVKDDIQALLKEEEILGFSVTHFRSDRYHPVEIAAIIRHLIAGLEEVEDIRALSEKLIAESEAAGETEQTLQEAHRFIANCHDAFHRAQIAFENEEKRCWQLGVILMREKEDQACEETPLDRWDESEMPLENQLADIEKERETWDRCCNCTRNRLRQRNINAPPKKHPMFQYNVECLTSLDSSGGQNKANQMYHSIKTYVDRKRLLATAAEKVKVKDCVLNVMQAMKKENARDPSVSHLSGKGKRLIAVFGFDPPDSDHLPVVVRTVPLRDPSSDADSEHEAINLIEIGLTLEGSFQEYEPQKEEGDNILTSSATIKLNRSELRFFKYVKPGCHVPHSKTIEELFRNSDSNPAFTHVLLSIPELDSLQTRTGQRGADNNYSEVSDAGGRFLVDLKTPGAVKTGGTSYYPLPVKPEASAKPPGKESSSRAIPFLRVALMLPPSIPPGFHHFYVTYYEKLSRKAIAGFSESAEIISQVLVLAYGARTNRSGTSDSKSLTKRLERSPLLLYYTTIELLNFFSDSTNNFAKTVADYWMDKLKLNRDAKTFLTREDRESRELVWELITAGSAQGQPFAPSPSSKTAAAAAGRGNGPVSRRSRYGGAHAALSIAMASESHLKFLPSIIRDETKFNQQSVFVEETNFESTLQRLRVISTASITFIFVYITGRMSAHQLEQLVRSVSNPIKLIFRDSQSLQSLLELTSVRDLIYQPPSLRSDEQSETSCVLYASSPVGAVVKNISEKLHQEAKVLQAEGEMWDAVAPEEFVADGLAWEDRITEWLTEPVDGGDKYSSYVRTLVTAEHARTCERLEASATFHAVVYKAGSDTEFHKLKAFLDNEHPPLSAEAPASISCSEKLPLIVLSHAYFLPHSRLEVLVSRCCVQKSKLLLLVNSSTSTMARFRVFRDVRSPPVWITVPTISQRFLSDTSHSIAFRGLQMIFSHQVVTSDHASSLNRSTGGEDDDGFGNLRVLEQEDSQRSFLKDLLDALNAKSDECCLGVADKTTTLAGILGTHVRRYLLQPQGRAPHVDVSFKDFCSQPRVRFFCQIQRVEAYICYLFTRTAVAARLQGPIDATTPLGVPLIENFVLHDNTHEGSSPIKLLSAVYDPKSAAGQSLPPPAYLDPGSGDAMLHMQEIAEHRAVGGDELHWEQLAEKWQTCHDLDAHSLDHILKYSPARISVVLSLSVQQILNLQLSNLAYEAVKRDFVKTVTLLRACDRHVGNLRERVASVCWMILRTGNAMKDASTDQLSTDFFTRDYNILIQVGFKPDLKICAENMRLLSSFTRAIIGLDSSKALIEQHAVCTFLFSNTAECAEEVAHILDQASLGSTLVWACVASERNGSIIAGKCGNAIFQRLGALLQWMKNPDDTNAASMGEALRSSTVPNRLTAHAISAILQNIKNVSGPSKVMKVACSTILSICVQRSSRPAALFLGDILNSVCAAPNGKALAVALMCAVAKETCLKELTSTGNMDELSTEVPPKWLFPIPDALNPDEPWEMIFNAFRDETSNAGQMFDAVLATRFHLPFNASNDLCRMYVAHVESRPLGTNSVGLAVKQHKALLPDEASRGAVFTFMVRRMPDSVDVSDAAKVLLWYTWWFEPTSSLPPHFAPTEATWVLFQEVLRELRAEVEMSLGRLISGGSGLSTWARFVLAPYTLPVSIFNVLRAQVVDGSDGLIESEAFVLAQRNHTTFPAYSFRAHSRALPPVCIRALVRAVAGKAGSILRNVATQDAKKRFPQTHLGVSTETILHNLKILVNLDRMVTQGEISQAHIFLTIRVWFQAAGFKLSDVKDMCPSEVDKKQLMLLDASLLALCRRPDFPQKDVLLPLPVYVDVRFVFGKVALFGPNAESRATTKQWITMLLLQYGLESMQLPERFERCAQVRCGQQSCNRTERYEIVKSLFINIGASFVSRDQRVDTSDPAATTRIVNELLPIAEFFSQLQISISMDPDPESEEKDYERFAQNAFDGLAASLQSSDASLQICVADGLFVLLGVTPLNDGIEVSIMLDCWRKYGLECGSSVIAEIHWVHNNLYKAGKIGSRLKAILSNSPRTQTFTRPSASRPLVSFLDESSAHGPGSYDVRHEFFGEVIKSLQSDHVARALHAEMNPVPKTQPAPAPVVANHGRSFDHVPHGLSLPAPPSVGNGFAVFKARTSTETAARQRQMAGTMGNKPVRLNKSPQTISARELVHLDCGPDKQSSRFAILKIQPGLHPILRSAGDECNTPVLQCKREKNHIEKSESADGRSSFDCSDADACTRIENIFSHNGDTWLHLNKLPAESTVVGQGFHLRKTDNQGWIFLLGTSDETAIHLPPFCLWTLMDTMHLGSLDFNKDVVQILKGIVLIAFESKPDVKRLRDDEFFQVLLDIRKWSQEDGEQTKYKQYLVREESVCEHFLMVLDRISHCRGSQPLSKLLCIEDLEQALDDAPNQKHELCKTISRVLCIVTEKRDSVPRSQLVFSLELALENLRKACKVSGPEQGLAGEFDLSPEHFDLFADSEETARSRQEDPFDQDVRFKRSYRENKQIAAHAHITKAKFRQRSVAYISSLENQCPVFDARRDWTKTFDDSDAEEDETETIKNEAKGSQAHSGENPALDNACTSKDLKTNTVERTKYVDESYDTTTTVEHAKLSSLLPARWGYGLPTSSRTRVLSLLGESVPLYFQELDCRRLKIKYSNAEGLPIAVVFHKTLLHRVLSEYELSLRVEGLGQTEKTPATPRRGVGDRVSKLLHFREQLLRWLTDLVRSPLPLAAIYWFMDKLEHGATTLAVPFMGGERSHEEDINLKAVAHCLASAAPTAIAGREIFMGFDLGPELLPFCTRKNDVYGIHLVRGGTLTKLEEWGVNVEVCELGYDALTQAKDNASMYLSIVGRFSKYTWIVYVTGLDSIDDALLKWLAEYTKLHPWRFVFLENTQTSWNFSENRDRCCYFAAPPTIESKIERAEDLKSEDVATLRPHHHQQYDRLSASIETSSLLTHRENASWDDLSRFCSTFFGSSEPVGDGGQVTLASAEAAWQAIKPESMKKGEQDLDESVGPIFTAHPDTPCVVLLCSPPGTGKSHFSEELARSVNTQSAIIDGSDDRLVDMALREILDLELPDAAKRLFLIVDEFHMLNESHKVSLFSWLRERARMLQVLLIANRKDARDDELLDKFRKESGIAGERVQNIATRLSQHTLNKVMDEHEVTHKDEIRRWIHCARCLFGGEAVSLRNILDLQKAMRNDHGRELALEMLLLHKMPIISKATASEFVQCFSASFLSTSEHAISNIAGACKGPVSLMFQAALLTENQDMLGMDFPDFVAFGLKRAYDAPPSLRIAAWCCHMRSVARARNRLVSMAEPKSIFTPALVDQCGFPLQLVDEHRGEFKSGLAFSWSGDYSQLREITNAVKHGHSVDWNDVSRRCWQHEPVQDSPAFVELLSVCTSPGKVLEALTMVNLCDLLKKSAPADALYIAYRVLDNQTHRAETGEYPNPYRTAVWMLLLYEESIKDVNDILAAMSASKHDLSCCEILLVDALRWASVNMHDMVECAHQSDPKLKDDLLVKILKQLSKSMIARGEPTRVPFLWQSLFAPLLQTCLPSAASPLGERELVAMVAIHADDQATSWPGPVQALWKIAHGQGNASHVSDLWAEDGAAGVASLRPLLSVGAAGEGPLPIQRDFAGGILAVDGEIPTSLQEALLLRGGDANLDRFADDVQLATAKVIDTIDKIAVDKTRSFHLAPDTEFELLVLKTAAERFKRSGKDSNS